MIKRTTFDDFVGQRELVKHIGVDTLEDLGYESHQARDLVGFRYGSYYIVFDATRGKFWTIAWGMDDEFSDLAAAEIWLFEQIEEELNWDYNHELKKGLEMLDPQLG